ncbi:hypothetical protein L9F63_018739 [Diploptera punctata]|uniref:Fatty acyl-CoA reductase n=1 Tax=Diploptera punctata TaxID=6984 RepID=A0AAD8EES4_DIPPU|nr:hypothetical protein L9F63_018739 [Diploptera punctata]
MSGIQESFRGSTILVTGATGFLGQLMVEKLLRTCSNLDMIYVLVRPKKGKNEEDRLKQIFDGHLFEPLKKLRPDFLSKVRLICGDCRNPCLGLSAEDVNLLKQKLNFIFHIAATVRFDQHIHTAYDINVGATVDLIQIAKEAQNLKAFVHISTAYSNCPRKVIDECFYEPSMRWRELRQLVDSLDDESLSALTPLIIDKWPNTYSFTKCLAEDAIRDLGKDLPIAIVRPSVVVSTAKEPLSNWINNVYGAGGVAAGAAVGLIRVMRADEKNVMDIVPADYVINSSIAAAWEVTSSRPSDPIILNYVSSTQRPITFGQYMKDLKCTMYVPALFCMWYYFLTLESQRLVYNVYSFFLHTIPALIADFIAVVLRKQPRLIKGYMKVHKFIDVIAYFAVQEWSFNNNNVQTLWKKLSEEDKKLFNFDISGLEWDVFLFHMLRGVRLYTIGETFETLEKAKAHYFRLKVIHFSVVYAVQLLLLWTTYQLLKYTYSIL